MYDGCTMSYIGAERERQPMDERLILRISKDLLDQIRGKAAAEGRSVSNYVRWNLEQLVTDKRKRRRS